MPEITRYLAKNARPLAIAGLAAIGIGASVKFASETSAQSTNNPLVAVSLLYDPAVSLINHGEQGMGRQHIELAKVKDVGSTYGLAFDPSRRHLYVASANIGDRYINFGPGGPGAIYQIGFTGEPIKTWAVLQAGQDSTPNPHDFELSGRNSLGDIEVSGDNSTLFVTNLYDQKIYTFSLPDGQEIGSFPNAGVEKPWGENARPFGLGYHDGHLYQGVVDSRENIALPGDLNAYVYKSNDDGSGAIEVFKMQLGGNDYYRWEPYNPLVADIEFRPKGELVVGLRDRHDYLGFGELIRAIPKGANRWEAYAKQWYNASTSGSAAMITSTDQTVTYGFNEISWLNNLTGIARYSERISGYDSYTPLGGGDVEILTDIRSSDEIKPPSTPTNTPDPRQPSPTARPPTRTPWPTVTPYYPPEQPTRAPWQTVTPYNTPERPCGVQDADIGLTIDVSDSMHEETAPGETKLQNAVNASKLLASIVRMPKDRISVVAFDDEAELKQPLSGDRDLIEKALDILETKGGTHIHNGIMESHRELISTRRMPDNKGIIVLLTDGQSDKEPAIWEADMAKADGLRILTIGFGNDADESLLRQIATIPEDYHFAPDGATLELIYRQIAEEIICLYTPTPTRFVSPTSTLTSTASPTATATVTATTPHIEYIYLPVLQNGHGEIEPEL